MKRIYLSNNHLQVWTNYTVNEPKIESATWILMSMLLMFFFVFLYAGISSVRWGSRACPESVRSQTTSPDGAWVASVTSAICGNDWMTNVVGGVDLIHSGGSGKPITILGVSTTSDDSEYPRVAWEGSTALKIIIRHASFLKVLHRTVPGVTIGIELESRDAKEQAIFAKKMYDAE